MSAPLVLSAQPEFMPWGNLSGLRIEGERVPFETSLRAVRADWSGYTQSSKYNWEGRQTYTHEGDVQVAEHALEGLPVAYRIQTRDEGDGQAEIRIRVTLQENADLAGIYFCLSLPAAPFADAQLELLEPVIAARPYPLSALASPLELPVAARGVRVQAGGRVVEVLGGPTRRLLVRRDATTHPAYLNDPRPRQDFSPKDPQGRIPDWQIYFPLLRGPGSKGTEIEQVFRVRVAAEVDRHPVGVTLDPSRPGRAFEGIGGNFRLQFPERDPAVIDYCLKNLRVTRGRIAMYWRDWHPEETEDPVARARAGRLPALLRGQMELARSLARRGLPIMVSVWDPPRWAADPWPNGERGEALKPEKLGAIARSISDYLVYLKSEYGVEAELFSFNETDVGVEVRETPEMHARHAGLLGEAFAARGLKTRILLGDTGHGTAAASRLVGPAIRDPAARTHAGALAFHTYHGCTPEDLAAWTAASQALNLPLMVTEGGPDSAAHRYPQVFLEPWFALQEIELYLRIAAACQPTTIMPWQLTSDYSVLIGNGLYGDHGPLRPTQRFWNLQQLGATPAGARWLPVACDRPNVTVAAWGDVALNRYGVHLVNHGATREVTLRGLPARVRVLQVHQTDALHGAEEMDSVPVEDGVARFLAPAGAFLSLGSQP